MRTLLAAGPAGDAAWENALRLLRRESPDVRTHQVPDDAAFDAALEAGSFDAALVRSRREPADSDVADGEALARKAREAKRRLPDRPVVLLVDESDEPHAIAALRAGVDDYVVASPQRLHRLPTAVATALARGEAARRAAGVEAALRESEQKLRAIVAQLPCHLWTTDAQLRVTSVAGVALAAIGIDPARYVGAAIPDLAGAGAEPVRAHRRALAGKVEHYSRTFAGRDFEARVQPLRDPDGRIVGCLGLALDVTEQRRAERKLALQRTVGQLLREASDFEHAAPEILRAVGEALEWDYGGLWVVDWDENVLRCAATWWRGPRDKGPSRFEEISRLTPFPPGVGLPGAVWAGGRARWIASTAAARFPRLRRAQSDGLRSGFAVPVRMGGQTVGVLEFLSRELRRRDTEQIGAVTSLAIQIGQFIERRRAERLAELERLRRGFVQTVSHDLRTPLTTTRAGLGLLTTRLTERLDPEEARLVAVVQRNVERLESFVDDLLALNHLDIGVLSLSRRDLDLRTVLEDAVPPVGPLLREKGQTVQVDAPEPLPCTGDARQLVRAVGNLLCNAHHRAPRDAHLSMHARPIDAELRVVIRGAGTGPPEELEWTLSLGREQPESDGASGFGLAIARRIVELHGGRMWAESHPSGGVDVHLTLPRRQ